MKTISLSSLGALTAMLILAPLTSMAVETAVPVDQARAEHHQARRSALMKRFDKNADGKLDQAERGEARKAIKKHAYKIAKKLHKMECHEKRLAKFDTNKDGKLDTTEREAMKAAHAKKS